MQLKYHHDPGHGWLEVPMYAAIKVRTPLTKISPYSYVGFSKSEGVILYLEEDCDMPIFMAAAAAAGLKLSVTNVTHEDNCFVRKLNHFPEWSDEAKQA